MEEVEGEVLLLLLLVLTSPWQPTQGGGPLEARPPWAGGGPPEEEVPMETMPMQPM